MPWKETHALSERTRFIAKWLEQELTMAELCRMFGVSRKTGYKWLRRVLEDGEAGLRERSCAPHHSPNRMAPWVADKILNLRGQKPTWGPRKLLHKLRLKYPDRPWPAPSTAGQLLRREGLAVARKRRRKATPSPNGLTQAEAPNGVWTADFKGWFRTGDGRRCTPLTIADGNTRYLLRCQAMDGRTDFEAVGPLFDAVFRQYGLPAVIRTDNGPPFASTGRAGLSRLAVWWIGLGITPERIEPGEPQQNGRHERMHRTLKEDTLQPPAANAGAQQRCFDRYLKEFNQERPHEGIGMRTPASIYEASPRTYPRPLRVMQYPHGWMVRKVKCHGRIKWDGAVLHLSDALTGQYVGLEPTEDGWWDIYFDSILLGHLDEEAMRIVDPDVEK